MTRTLRDAVAATAVVGGTTGLMVLFDADSTDALIAYLAGIVLLSFTIRRSIALIAAAGAAVALVRFFLLPHQRFSLDTVDGWLALAALTAASTASTYVAESRRAYSREREAYIEKLRDSEAALERRVDERTEDLRRTEERLRLAGRATNDALWDWDVASGALWWNDSFASLFGLSDHTPTFEGWMAMVHPDDAARVSASLRDLLAGRENAWRSEYRFRRANGSYAWVLDRGFAVRDAGGAATRVIGAMMDISERKEAERMKSDFVSFVSHQLRTPLAGMNWMLELAADSGELPEAASEYIAEARESAARLVTLVNDLLDIARLESGRAVANPERLDLPGLTDNVLREMQPMIDAKHHSISVEAQPAEAWADPQLVRQVVGNLLSNAVKYTPPSGRISVSIAQDHGVVQWRVADSGVGVPRAAQARLFERFFRADNAVAMEVEGTGLGLHLVRLIVEQAGGRVWCESEEGRGAVFAFTLPAVSEGAFVP